MKNIILDTSKFYMKFLTSVNKLKGEGQDYKSGTFTIGSGPNFGLFCRQLQTNACLHLDFHLKNKLPAPQNHNTHVTSSNLLPNFDPFQRPPLGLFPGGKTKNK